MITSKSITTHFEFSQLPQYRVDYIKNKLVQRYGAHGWLACSIRTVGPFQNVCISFDVALCKEAEDTLIKYVEQLCKEPI